VYLLEEFVGEKKEEKKRKKKPFNWGYHQNDFSAARHVT
jgi:hypothetical protein